ncbi:MAG: hypothetical protein HY657_04020 [Acidobacteria bacterium]|nr:hypothetical protein [Acidobacteriota bacterium]
MPTLPDLMKQAYARGVALEVVVGTAPAWTDPWTGMQRARVVAGSSGYPSILVDDRGSEIPREEIQWARLPEGPG